MKVVDHTTRPKCLNPGCSGNVAHCGTRWRPFCSRCHKANYGAAVLKVGVLPFKTGRCSNSDGHLGFVCAIDYDKAPWAIGQTQIDHSDGNHLNNIPENCDELCDMCHTRKGKLAGDFRNQRRTEYRYAKAA